MGIKDLWSILQPYCERRPLLELQGKRVAIDLSGWVCQAQCIADYQVQPKMYLRNLYFRTCFLLLHDVQMVFVLEGKAPTLKLKTIAARNELQFKGAAPRAPKRGEKHAQTNGRSRFDHTLKQCEEMLALMGLACIAGKGEAEALCAHLNKQKLVEGCISQDSDCFAYGAETVYRNFSISMQGAQASAGGSVDIYNIKQCKKDMDFGRNKVIALALLCGSDYNEGVFGVGKETALKYFSSVSENDVLAALRGWRAKRTHYERVARDVDERRKCSACAHVGRKVVHTRSGCVGCGTPKGCHVNETHVGLRLELQLREKALLVPAFPDESLIGEFLQEKDNVADVDLRWRMPDLARFIEFTCKHLQWEEIYAFRKLFPILTRWRVLHSEPASSQRSDVIVPKPERVRRRRARKGVACYELDWECEHLLPLIPPEQIVASERDQLFATIEPSHLVEAAFPSLVAQFEASQLEAKTRRRRRPPSKKQAKPQKRTYHDDSLFDDVDDNAADLSLLVDGICARGVPLAFRRKCNELLQADEASFFQLNTNEDQMDAFEYSMYAQLSSDQSEDDG